ncbi:bleomycin resistance protein [Candidatus Entotheonella palauensis]|uniref:bleomycin resistance protein n=1 Tax=Candidatus Entotheonella palauensis TaxID=93172 RepID=UPI000B7FC894|nr:VOC family protein [Candidatus Entotheonella palauensis]
MDNGFIHNALVPELYCSRFEESRAFYTETLGFHILFEREEEGFAYMERDGAQIMIDELTNTTNGSRSWLAGPLDTPFGRGINLTILTEDVDSLYERVKSRGATLFLEMEEKWYRIKDVYKGNRQFIVQDPDGYLLRFFQDIGTRDDRFSV